MLDRSFASLLPVDAYGPIAKTFHYAAQFLRNWGWLVLAGLEAKLGRTKAALADYRKARDLNPTSPLFQVGN